MEYVDFDQYIKAITKMGDGVSTKYPMSLEFDTTTFRVSITLDPHYQIDLTKLNVNDLIGFDKKLLKDPTNFDSRVPNLSQDSDVLNIHCDLISSSLVERCCLTDP